jgi:hypothetical protein
MTHVDQLLARLREAAGRGYYRGHILIDDLERIITKWSKEQPALSAVSHTNLEAIAYHLEQGEDNGGITREALSAFLRHVAKQAAGRTP